MLTWDDEVKPTPSKSASSGFDANREAPLSPTLQPLPHSPATSPQPQVSLRTLEAAAAVATSMPQAIAPITVRPAAAAAAPDAAKRRVTAADKRIINGQTDVNQLVPFKYKWAWRSTSRPAPTTGCRRKST